MVFHGFSRAPRGVTASGAAVEALWDGRAARFEAGVGERIAIEP